MKSTLGSMIGFALCALLMTACGDANDVTRFGGGTICASDDPDAGDMFECPGSDKTFDFCINTGNGSCYYVVDGAQLNCGNCFENDTLINCFSQAEAACE